MALIVVLGSLIFLSALLLAFLSSVKTELVTSKAYADNNSVNSLVNTSVNIVMSQIRQATTVTATDCWTSQPGLIRTFTNTGVADQSYKLYSSDTMQISGALDATTLAATTLANWSQKTALFTDLNQPVSGIYPILDPSALNTVQGYSVTGAPTTATQSAPMPVQWIYVLRDGTLLAPSAASTNTVAAITGATTSNPIVGRIAFWTDDESCKVNINTASEGEYWDVPHFEGQFDVNLGLFQPVKNEFQGYPGHPAGVSLSTVFPGLVSGPQATEYDKIYAIAPRIASGGSFNLTVTASMSLNAAQWDTDRLYDSAEELMFSSTYSSGRSINTGLTQDDLEKAKFFITAHSRSPETTLFGTPKVVCWPINADLAGNANSPFASAFDKLIAFCGTVNKKLYYFQRQNKDSTTNDYANITRNQNLYTYLHTLMATNVPGFGGNLATKFGADSDQILTEIFDYIRCANLNDMNLATANQFAPGTANSFGRGEVAPITIGSTRGFGRFVTFNEAALWVICTADPTVTTSIPLSNNASNLTLDPPGLLLNRYDVAIPPAKEIRIEAALILDPFTPMHGAVPMKPDIEILISGLDNWTIQGDSDAAVTNFGFPSQAQQTYGGAGVFQLGQPPDWTGETNAGGYMGFGWTLDSRGVRARNSGRLIVDPSFTSGHPSNPAAVLNVQYPFVSEPRTVKVKQTSPTLAFSGGTITATIRQRTTGTVIQTLTFNFPGTTLQAPGLYANKDYWTFQASGSGLGKGRFVVGSWPDYHPGNTGKDIIYSMVAAQGGQTLDPRFIAMTGSDSTGALFSPHPNYMSGGTAAHSLILSSIWGIILSPNAGIPNQGTLAKLTGANKMPFTLTPCPKVPYQASDATTNGDWDNGIGWMPDGGFLNEPDQGVLPATGSGYGQTPYFSNHMATGGSSAPTINFTSPSRIMPSPGMFGSLPTTFARSQAVGFTGAGKQGWQTLLFRRQPTHPEYVDSGSASPKGNGGFSNAPDYLMMDLFWMPVVEPYAISEPLSTAGKLNMNYQIVPFTYIERSTGLYAVLKHEKVISVPTSDYNKVYKNGSVDPTLTISPTIYRCDVQIPQTLTQFQQRFNNADATGLYAFRTPSEICDMHIIPDNASPSTASKSALDADMASYWSTHTLTGDNCRERIYTTLYPRLTTRSNTFRVHYRVQTLKKRPNSTASQWTEGSDFVTGEGRGSVLIERFVDASDVNLPDYALNAAATPSLESRYQFRVLSVNRFDP